MLPVIGTTLIIWAGPHAWINRKFLADQKIVFIGLISYPLYLWHWPLIVISRAVVTDYSPANHHVRTTTIVAVVISFVLSWLTFEFVERPIRTRYWLTVGCWRICDRPRGGRTPRDCDTTKRRIPCAIPEGNQGAPYAAHFGG